MFWLGFAVGILLGWPLAKTGIYGLFDKLLAVLIGL